MNTESTAAPANPQRDARGRFQPGNPGGPGNPFARQVAALRQALLNRVTPQDIQDVAGKLIELAREGNVQAAKLLLAYTIGKPQPAPEPDRMDADEWGVYRETTPMKTEAAAVIAAGDPEYHLRMTRTMRPVVAQVMQLELENAHREELEREAEDKAEDEAWEADGGDDDQGPSPVARTFEELIAPSLNGHSGTRAPSTNGVDGAHPPSANGNKRGKRRKHGGKQPSTNGKAAPKGELAFSR